MPFSYLPGPLYFQIVAGQIDMIFNGQLMCTMTSEEARSNAADLLEMATAIDAGSTVPVGMEDLT